MIKCSICDESICDRRKLAYHIRDRHKLQTREYYDQYLKTENEENCVICGSKCSFKNFVRGYNETCGFKCSAILRRQKLKDDQLRFRQFSEKVKANQTRIWDERSKSGENVVIGVKISEKLKEINSHLTKEELIEKYGWLNKLDIKEKRRIIEDILTKSLRKWWKTATKDQIRNLVRKRKSTMIKNGNASSDDTNDNNISFNEYRRIVRNLTEISYNNNKHIIDPNNKRSMEYHLDHKISILHGFINNIDFNLMSCVHNLEIISSHQNLSKNSDCSIEIEVLIDLYEGEIDG